MSTGHTTAPQSPLDLMRNRKDAAGAAWIGPAAFMAGERLTKDLTFAGILPKVTMDWGRGAPRDKGAGGAGLNPTEAAIAARQRMQKALDAVGPEFGGVLIDFCGFEKGLETLERDRNWPVRSGKVVVKLALAALARHYGYSDNAQGRDSGRMRLWAAPGSRPAMNVRQ
jgi:Domain of unknown function (DUF6456)